MSIYTRTQRHKPIRQTDLEKGPDHADHTPHPERCHWGRPRARHDGGARAGVSVEITQNAKGQTQVSVKLYGENPDEVASQALALYRKLAVELATAN
jgi:hypothetical protein